MRSDLSLFQNSIRKRRARLSDASGFSLIELLIAMAILLVMMAGASRLLMSSLNARTRENQKSDALADAQRALNLMSREISNAGFGLNYNGLVAIDCHPNSTSDSLGAQIRIRANTDNRDTATSDSDEDVTYVFQDAPVSAIVRYDRQSNTQTILANQIEAMEITYIDGATPFPNESTIATPSVVENAQRVRINIKVRLDATATQSASQVSLTSEIALRNAPAIIRRF